MKKQIEILISGLIATTVLVALCLAASPAVFAQTPTFGQPTISGIQGVGFEQDLRLGPPPPPPNPQRVYTSVPGSLSSDTSWIWHSEDGGKTFKWVTAATAKEGKPNVCAGGGDTELAVDSAGNLYFNDLTLANFSTARSPDNGATFVCSNHGVPDTAVDRQWYTTDGDPTISGNIYLANDEIGPGAVTCPVSGVVNNVLAMYRSPLPLSSNLAGIQFGPGFKVTRPLQCDEGIMGNNQVSPVATATGQPMVGGSFATLVPAVKHIYVVHDDATFSKIAIGRCFPVAFGAPLPNVSDPSGLNCVDLPVAMLGTIPPGKSFPTAKTGGNFPTLAIDTAGNLYVVWEQAPSDPTTGNIMGDTVLMYSFSTDEGNHWSAPIPIPTPLLHNNVFAWPAAGDPGRVDIAFYGTSGVANPNDPNCGTNNGGKGGPDATTNAIWSLYMVQIINGNTASPTFTGPILAGEHYIHKGTIQTLIGGQCGDRTLGDFLQIRVGSMGEAQISYADSNNADEPFAPHGMYVKQNGGTGLLANTTVIGDSILLNSASDPAFDAKRETDGLTSANIANLDIINSSFSQPADCHPAGTPCYRVSMTIKDLSNLTPPAPDTVAVWLTQWLVPADPGCTSTTDACKKGGKNPFVYFESNGTGTSCWSGENAAQLVGGGATLTYPGTKQIDPSGCLVTQASPGTITIDVPIADVSLPGVNPLSPTRLYSVTASTMTISAGDAEHPVPDKGVHNKSIGGVSVFNSPIGGQLFDLIDVVRAYDATVTNVQCLEDDDPRIAYDNGWHTVQDSNASAGHFHLDTGNDVQHALKFTFQLSDTGTLQYFFAKSTKGGTAQVLIDGNPPPNGPGIINYQASTGTAGSGSMRDPFFRDGTGTPFSVTYNLPKGPHSFELVNLNGPAYVDEFCLTNGGSSTMATAGPGTTTTSTNALALGQSLLQNVSVPSNVLGFSVAAESDVNVPYRLVVIDPTGNVLGSVNSSSNGIASVSMPVSTSGLYAIQLVNAGLSPVNIWIAATPQVTY